jgi:hypothetical protein
MRIAKERAQIECKWVRIHGSSDARHFAPFNIPVILLLPKGGDRHTENEWVDIADLHRFYDIMKAWTLELAESAAPAPLSKRTERGVLPALIPSPLFVASDALARVIVKGATLPGKMFARMQKRK